MFDVMCFPEKLYWPHTSQPSTRALAASPCRQQQQQQQRRREQQQQGNIIRCLTHVFWPKGWNRVEEAGQSLALCAYIWVTVQS
jgi:hypothetical protein